MQEPHLRAAALHVQGIREAKRIVQEEGVEAETAAFVGYMLGLELGLTLAQTDLEWARAAHDELTVFEEATGQGDRRARRRTLLAQATAIIRATQA
jgi:hypothetical protein